MHGALLVRICEVMAGRDRQAMSEVREEAFAAMGEDAAVDAIAVSALFHLMNRVANATGTPLDERMIKPAKKISGQIGADDYLSHNDALSTD